MPAKAPIEERFWAKVNKTDGCWLWTGGKTTAGYGSFNLGRVNGIGRVRYAHRLSWEMANGPLPDGMHICHRCDTPACVNPEHMFIGTAADNMRDCISKGRFKFAPPAPGEANPKTTLTEFEVIDIKTLRAFGAKGTDLAREFGVSVSCISNIGVGKTWGHV